jgi:putative Ca2+/H+ antiporter (TMEM165/GDT1 family)
LVTATRLLPPWCSSPPRAERDQTEEAADPPDRLVVYSLEREHPFKHREGLLVTFDTKALLITFGLVFLAELGDKTQLSF